MNSYTAQRYKRTLTWVMIGLTVLYSIAANVFLVMGLLHG